MCQRPHKWLFSPFDCAALVYANPALARVAHTQHAGYLEPIIDDSVWNPCDYANVLTRRARGMPFWFSLAVYGTDAYTEAIEQAFNTSSKKAEQMKKAKGDVTPKGQAKYPDPTSEKVANASMGVAGQMAPMLSLIPLWRRRRRG